MKPAAETNGLKTACRILLLALAFVAIFTRCDKEPEPEPQPENVIRDVNFHEALLERGFDTNGDGMISSSEAAAVDYLDVSACGITSFNGIEAFIHLLILDCHENRLTGLDVSGNTDLIELNCSGNQMSALDLSVSIK